MTAKSTAIAQDGGIHFRPI